MFVDTNVLVVARSANAPGREAELEVLAQTRRTEPLSISHQIIREYLAVVTRPQTWASPLPMPDALQDVIRFAAALRCWKTAKR